MQLQQSIHDEACLLVFVAHGDEPRLLAAGALRPETLGEPFGRPRDHRVRDVENWLRGAIVLLERDRARAGEMPRKIQDVALRGAAERINTLRVVADDRDVLVRAAHPAEDATLQLIRVLI